MPTLQQISRFTETDMGWAIARPVKDLAGGVVAIDVECKSCACSMRYDPNQPGIVSRFDHAPTCPVLIEVRATSEPWRKRAPHN